MDKSGLYSIRAAVVLTGLSPQTIYNLCSLHKALLDAPRYRLKKLRRHRLLTADDIAFLSKTIRVKEKK